MQFYCQKIVIRRPQFYIELSQFVSEATAFLPMLAGNPATANPPMLPVKSEPAAKIMQSFITVLKKPARNHRLIKVQ